MPTLTCPHCQSGLSVDPGWFGKVVRCPVCGASFQVPLPSRSGGQPPPIPEAEWQQRPSRVEVSVHQPMNTGVGLGFGTGFGWTLGVIAAIVFLNCLCCGGLALLASLGSLHR